jgi:hypothetical protein
MAHPSFDELEWYLRRLRYAREAGKLVFVLGAGIGREYDIPDWSGTLVDLLTRCGKLHTAPPDIERIELKQYMDRVIADPLLLAAAIRGAYASLSDWLRAVDDVLRYDKAQLADRSKPLGKVAQVAVEQWKQDQRRHIPILTFNFDDVMEEALRIELGDAGLFEHAVGTVSDEWELGRVRQRPGIYVYHLHGALANPKSDVVLDAYNYVRILAAPGNHWSWTAMNTFLFQRDAGSMFIGLSLLDPSLRLLLTRWATLGMPLSAIFIGKPLEPPLFTPRAAAHKIAWMMRDVQTLFDNLLEELSLIPYHVTDWSEVGPLIERVRIADV